MDSLLPLRGTTHSSFPPKNGERGSFSFFFLRPAEKGKKWGRESDVSAIQIREREKGPESGAIGSWGEEEEEGRDKKGRGKRYKSLKSWKKMAHLSFLLWLPPADSATKGGGGGSL